MLQTRRIPITEINEYLTCKLCKGYFIDATTIIECLHTFCRSCIVKYLENNKYCPVCDVQVHKTKPLLNIRPDKTLQDIVYKLVPRLFQNEMCKRREFYTSHPEVRPSNLEQCGEVSYQHILSPDETICISLNYHGHSGPPRYLRCPAAISVVHIQKLLRAKYDLCKNHRIDILHNQDCLNSHLTLMDIAYIYLWRRKGPLDLTYRIYENTAKRLKLDSNSSISATEEDESSETKNEWKEVQLRISETGEMCVTGVDNTTILNEEVAKGNMIEMKSEETSSKKDIPPLKPITKTSVTNTCVKNKSICSEEAKPNATTTASQLATTTTTITTINTPCTSGSSNITFASFVTTSTLAGAGGTRSTTTCTYTTLSSVTSCTTSRSNDGVGNVVKDEKKKTTPSPNAVEDVSSISVVPSEDKQSKRKNSGDAEGEPPSKQPKPTILNHSLALQGISLKQQSPKTTENGSKDVPIVAKTTTSSNVIIRSVTTVVPPINVPATSTAPSTSNKPIIINKSYAITRPTTPAKKWSSKTTGPVSVPCYTPKTTYNSVLNVPRVSAVITRTDPKPSTSTPNTKNTSQSSNAVNVQTSSIDTKSSEFKPTTVAQATVNNKSSVKGSKTTAVPLGAYRTLREPPKSWNSQISKAHVQKTGVDVKAGESKNAKPAKFFKMRNNIPRYLGNPASGVKPMYQVHCSPEKDKASSSEVNSKPESKTEIKKHSIVKIDPKTLKPISEKAPETTSLSNQSDLKINTSSVPIFNPLKLQNSPKNERKSPKSPHSPPKIKTSSPTSKRDKLSLNFTPPNPFVPNLTSPTLNPNQFLYSAVPPGFPAYDPRVVAAYHNLLYGQALPFPPNPVPRLNLELNQRKCFESPGSPKISSVCSITSSESMLYSCPKMSGISPQTSPRLPPDSNMLKPTTFASTTSQNHMKHYNVSSVTMTSPRTSTSTDQSSTSNSKSSGHHNMSQNQSLLKSSSSSESQKDEKVDQTNTQLNPRIPTSRCQDLSQSSSKNSAKNSSKRNNGKDGVKPEKSLENAVEKLTQSKTKENAIAQKNNDRIAEKNKNEKLSENDAAINTANKFTPTTTDEKSITEPDSKKKLKEEKSEMVNGRLTTSNGSLESKSLRSNDKETKNCEEKRDSNGNLPAKKLLDNRNCDEKTHDDAKDTSTAKETAEDKKLQKTTENSDLGNNNGNLLVQTDTKR
ncbi:mucin-5AC [Agrilus planipennis]|uniref:Mucin-5AC n=1 Tax=Agrilus planipennis TaxID=224129 RepID=A0A1W4XSN1_AGRPL|nr:mucin-5AC [Agrilus planipennis]XP_018335430.1 mucin-5AC [Agrilus planipennis]